MLNSILWVCIIAVCKDSYVVYSVDLTEWENDNDSQNQCISMRINENHYKYIDFHISVSFGLGPLKRQDLIFM